MNAKKGGNSSMGFLLMLLVLLFAFVWLVLPAFYDAFSPFSEANISTSKPEQIIALNSTPTSPPAPTLTSTPTPTLTPTHTPTPSPQDHTVRMVFVFSEETMEELGNIAFWNYMYPDILTYDQYIRLNNIQDYVYLRHNMYIFGRVIRIEDNDEAIEEMINEIFALEQGNKKELPMLIFFFMPNIEGEQFTLYFSDQSKKLSIETKIELEGVVNRWRISNFDPNNMDTLISCFGQIADYLDPPLVTNN